MGTVLAVLFIAAAAAIGIGVGLRPTVIDGRVIEAEITRQLGADAGAVACDREIRLGARGARFACTVSAGDWSERVEYEMTRDGAYARAGAPRAEP